MTETFTLDGRDDVPVNVLSWPTSDTPDKILLLLHGLGEHPARYARLADSLNAAGIALVAPTHRGHGENPELRGHFSDKHGWRDVIEDCFVVFDHLKAQYPETPIVLMGHSMGSFLAQSFAMQRSGELAGLVLSGSTWPSKLQVAPGWVLAALLGLVSGRREQSALLDKLGFGSLNKAFSPTRTEYDWLSRDEAEVDKYVADPLCGGPFTIGLWQDFLRGMLELASDSSIGRIRGDLPILMFCGEKDPVGGDRGLGNLMTHYAQSGHSRLKIRIYPDGRHEMLNEINRDEVTADVISWLGDLRA